MNLSGVEFSMTHPNVYLGYSTHYMPEITCFKSNNTHLIGGYDDGYALIAKQMPTETFL